MIREFANWIASTHLSTRFQEITWVVPASQSVHIIGISVVFASAVLINLRLLGVGSSGRSISELITLLVPWIWRGLAVLLFTGIVQTIAEPQRQFLTPAFWAKMTMIVIVTALTVGYTRLLLRRAGAWDATSSSRAGARTFAIVTTLLWVGIIACGRFIGYTWNLYV